MWIEGYQKKNYYIRKCHHINEEEKKTAAFLAV